LSRCSFATLDSCLVARLLSRCSFATSDSCLATPLSNLYRSRLLRSLFLWQSCISLIGIQRSLCELFCSHLSGVSVRSQFLGENVFFGSSSDLLLACLASGLLVFWHASLLAFVPSGMPRCWPLCLLACLAGLLDWLLLALWLFWSFAGPLVYCLPSSLCAL
jgi:hypothetical protein